MGDPDWRAAISNLKGSLRCEHCEQRFAKLNSESRAFAIGVDGHPQTLWHNDHPETRWHDGHPAAALAVVLSSRGPAPWRGRVVLSSRLKSAPEGSTH